MLLHTSVGMLGLNTPKDLQPKAERLGSGFAVWLLPGATETTQGESHRKQSGSLDAFPLDFSAGLA
jgi:hypothetical protein